MPLGTAPGFRDVGSTDWEGLTRGVGSNGYSWVSRSYDSGDRFRGMSLDFSVTGLHPSSTTSQAIGLQLRCLSE